MSALFCTRRIPINRLALPSSSSQQFLPSASSSTSSVLLQKRTRTTKIDRYIRWQEAHDERLNTPIDVLNEPLNKDNLNPLVENARPVQVWRRKEPIDPAGNEKKAGVHVKKDWSPTERRCGVLVEKIGMTSLWDENGNKFPVTMLKIDSCQVVQIQKPDELDPKHWMVTVGGGDVAPWNSDPRRIGACEVAGVNPKWRFKSFKVTENAVPALGSTFSAAHFVPGQYVDAFGLTKAKGIQGTIKKEGYKRQTVTHGNSKSTRLPGSFGGNTSPGRRFPGSAHPGKMGDENRLVVNLEVRKIDTSLNIVYVHGSIPGFKGASLVLTDSKPSLQWRAEKNMSKMLPREEWIGNGVMDLPFPIGDVELAKELPVILNGPPRKTQAY